jgi:hypothetical protein
MPHHIVRDPWFQAWALKHSNVDRRKTTSDADFERRSRPQVRTALRQFEGIVQPVNDVYEIQERLR